MRGIRLFLVCRYVLCCLFLFGTPGFGLEGEKDLDKTMLFFVGEELEVMTLASKKAETTLRAPAVATVIDAGEIERRGVNTLAELLETEPGFYMNHRASGTVPFLRGVQDGILFLYDGVPLTTNATRNVNVLDYELPLTNVRRVEIIRGPGSVIWGADAFAGIVNVVPFNGGDIKGRGVEAFAGSDRYAGGLAMAGRKTENRETFLSAYYARDRYHNTDYKIDTSNSQTGDDDTKSIDDSHYFEFSGNTALGEKFRLSGRLADNQREYVFNDSGSLSWIGKTESPSGFIKGTFEDRFRGFDLTLTTYAQYIEYNVVNVDYETEQSDWIYSGELLLHKAFSRSSQLTLGTSFRKSHVDGAVGDENFTPASLKPGIQELVLVANQVDYTNTLISAFGQYRHRWGEEIDSWIGMRYDAHSEYENTLSYSMGLNKPIHKDLRVKLAFGTAFRTPYPYQLIGYDPQDPERSNTAFLNLDPEKNSTANLQFLWVPDPGKEVSLTLFYSDISNMVFEDVYGGLSFPSDLKTWGGELAGSLVLHKDLDLFAALSLFNSKADSIRYRDLLGVVVQGDGTLVYVYDEWERAYDPGPQYMLSLGGAWKFLPKTMLTARLQWTGDIQYSFDENLYTGEFDITPTLSVGLKWREVLGTPFTLGLEADNLFDADNRTTGKYGPVEDIPFQFCLRLSCKF